MDRSKIKKHIWIYIIICLVISNILWYVGYSILMKDDESSIAMAIITLTSFMPAIVTLVMTKITKEGWDGLMILPNLKTGWKAYPLAVVFTWILIYLSDPFYLLIFKGNVTYTAEGSSLFGWIQVLLVSLLAIFASVEMLGEELGWMGYLFPRLEQLQGTNRSLLLIGLIRSLWHVGILLHMEQPIIGFMNLFISNCLSQSLLVYLTKKSKSIFPAAISHAITLLAPVFLVYSDEFYNQNIIVMNLVGLISAAIVGGICYYLLCREKLILRKE